MKLKGIKKEIDNLSKNNLIILAELIQKKVKNYNQVTLINISNNKFKKVK